MRFPRFPSTLAVLLLPGALIAQGPGYAVRKSIAIGGTGGWDYLAVDTARNRLYVSHGNQVEVVDLGKDSVVGVIPNTPGVHGIAIAYELGRGFVSGGRDSSVTSFELGTLAVIRRTNVGERLGAGCRKRAGGRHGGAVGQAGILGNRWPGPHVGEHRGQGHAGAV